MTDRADIPPRDKAAEGIRAYILERGLEGGDQLPPERELCEELGVSRTTLRGAVAQLVTQSVLESRQGSGTYLRAKRPISVLGRTFDYSEAVRGVGREPGARVISQEIVEAKGGIAEKFDVHEGTPIFALRRLRTADGEPTCVETAFINYELTPGIERFDFDERALYEVLDKEYGIVVEHSNERINIVQAYEWEAELLGIEPGTHVFLQRGLNKDVDMQTVEYFRSIILPSRFQLAAVYELGDEQ